MQGQELWHTSDASTRSRARPIGNDGCNGPYLQQEDGAPSAAAEKDPLVSTSELALVLSGAAVGDEVRSKGSVEAEGQLGLEILDAKLSGLDRKIERIAVAVGARTGSGVSEEPRRGVGGRGGET